MSDINTRFKELRIALKYSQKDFADNVGISRTHLSGTITPKSLTLIDTIPFSFCMCLNSFSLVIPQIL